MRILASATLLLAICLLSARALVLPKAPTSRGLCCSGSNATAASWGLPSFNPFQPPYYGCTVADSIFYPPSPTSPTPTAVQPNNTFIQEITAFFPYCKPMLDQWQSEGRRIALSVTPKNFDPAWEGFKANIITTLNSAYSLIRSLGHGSLVMRWINKDCLHVLMRSICHTVFREAFVPAPGLVLARPIPLEVIAAFDNVFSFYETQYNLVDKNPNTENPPSCRDVYYTFLNGLIAQNRTTRASVAGLLPYQDDCECGCASTGSSFLLTGQPKYQRGFLTYNLTARSLPVFTVNASTSTEPQSDYSQNGNWTCYLPWKESPESNPLSYCGLRCPSSFRTEHQYKQAAIMMGVIGWISYISTLFVFVTMVCMPRYRHFPANLVLFVLFSSHILAFAFVFTITRGWRRTVCRDSISPRWGYQSGDFPCVLNALTIIFGGLGTTFFWCAVAINSFIAIYLKRDSILRSKWFEIGTHVICWGVPFFCALIAVATKQIGTPQQLLFCFVTEDPYNPKSAKHFSWQYPLFFGPIGFCIMIATGAIVMVLYEMRNLRAASGSGRFNKHIRIALFLIVFLGIFAFVFAYRFTLTADGNQWRNSLVAWAQSAFEGTSQVGLSSEPSYGLFMAFNFFIGIQGALVSILFGSNTDVLTFWGERIQNIREGRSFFSGITSYTASSKVGASSVRTTGNADN